MAKMISFVAFFLIVGSSIAQVKVHAPKKHPERRDLSSIDFAHFGKGVQFKIQHRDEKHRLRGEDDENVRISRVVESVSKIVSHLTTGVEPSRVFRHAGIPQKSPLQILSPPF